MGELLRRVVDQQNLLDAWETTVDRMADEPAPRAETAAFAADLLANLTGLHTRLLDGTWSPSPVRRVAVPKADGRDRVLGVPTIPDRIVERAIAAVVAPVVDPHLQPDSYGFRSGLGINDAARTLQDRIDDGERWIVRTDLVDCFGSVSRRGCLRAVANLVEDDELVVLLSQIVHRPGSTGSAGLPQGAPLSPLLVNTYLDGLDRDLWDRGVSVIRYVDDIAATAHTEHEAQLSLELIRAACASRGLALGAEKTAVVDAQRGVRYLGRDLGTPTSVRPIALTDPSRITVHITSRGSALRARGNRFVVTGPEGPTTRHAATRTRMVVCNERVLISSAALSLAARNGVEVVVVDAREGVSAFFSAGTDRHAVRSAQQRAHDSAEQVLTMARVMVTGKILNSRVLLSRTKTRRAAVSAEVFHRLGHLVERGRETGTVAQLMGVEGAASRTYFAGLRSLVDPAWGFQGRNRRPPRDPVNAMLSYGYTVLVAEARRAVELAGLDPTLGFLHSSYRGRPALALDLAEEFRALIVDTTVLRLIGTGAVRPGGFSDTGEAGVRMDVPTKRALLTELERRMLTRVTHPIRRAPMSYRQVMEEQAISIARVVTGGTSVYHPMPWR
ncbi:CRISPR-associated endonuclease Cas1 [Pseudonocardia alni]|uniref:CRISPR-associated endonuclease Cas1 n=1 Tax=Pseudonocardia alni TaxID=33907 RepID=UPI0027A8C47D|nr:CRISPR-associated endonuclease Cas1 [Pseudonocardia alni]